MVTIDNNNIAYLKVAKGVDLKSYYHKKEIMVTKLTVIIHNMYTYQIMLYTWN